MIPILLLLYIVIGVDRAIKKFSQTLIHWRLKKTQTCAWAWPDDRIAFSTTFSVLTPHSGHCEYVHSYKNTRLGRVVYTYVHLMAYIFLNAPHTVVGFNKRLLPRLVYVTNESGLPLCLWRVFFCVSKNDTKCWKAAMTTSVSVRILFETT